MTATCNTRLLFNHTDLLGVNAGAWTLNRSAETYTEDIARVEHNPMTVHSVDQTINVPTMYSDPVSRAITTVGQGNNYVFAVINPPGENAVWVGGKCFVDGVDTTASTTDAVSKNVTFRPSEVWARGTSVGSFDFDGDAGTTAFAGSGPASFLVVTAYDANRPRVVTIGGVGVSVRNTGVYPVDLSAASGGEIEVAAGSPVAGYVLAGTLFDPPEEAS